MNKYYLITIFSFIFTSSCVMESPTTLYTFKIVNKANCPIIVNSHTTYYNEVSIDTLKPDESLEKVLPLSQIYLECGDTLIRTFFSNLDIRKDTLKIKMDPYLVTNWKDSLDLHGSRLHQWGKAYFKLVVKDSDLD